ncbi:MAG: ABC transporter ATP-binding protein [Candidatus Tectomicrobia bacterium]|uniref:ABC transporter ATP-binding protein n=1 Tax=Tectimicrobiota bacterium TaxID=2528274 RepID=A0A932M0N1_UNCTE|nr:ABC transporter ATP-binding protein [Candidatus Tectomicrobia bacterium]
MSLNSRVLEIRNLKTYFFTPEGVAKAVDGVSFTLHQGETLGLVGESGCGKTVTALSILRLIPSPPGRIVGGQVLLEERDLIPMAEAELRRIRGNQISMIFQEPMTSLNPVFTIGNQIAEVLTLHQGLNHRDATARAVELLDRVGIPSPERRVKEYPHQLSGGMRQRAMIAMALACNPRVLIADEPTTALDVTIQAQILDLMGRLKEEFQTAILLITHDLGIVAETAKRVVVMYAGKVVEEASVQEIFENPKHPYTQGLLKSIPRIDHHLGSQRERLREIPGTVPNLLRLPGGCPFHPRCPVAIERCSREEPLLEPKGEDHLASCWVAR